MLRVCGSVEERITSIEGRISKCSYQFVTVKDRSETHGSLEVLVTDRQKQIRSDIHIGSVGVDYGNVEVIGICED